MTRGQAFRERKYFVEFTIAEILKHKADFDYIKYAHTGLTDCEYIRIGDVQGRAITLDITARSLEGIVEDIARIILMGKEKIAPPANIITNAIELREINTLFK